MSTTFLACQLQQAEPGMAPVVAFVQRRVDELPPGDVLVRVAYSSINYKDALAAAGKNQIISAYPRTGGIDFSGTVAASADARFAPGDPVVVHGFGVGVDRDGGHAQMARVSADWVMPVPAGLSLLDAATLGAAGYTAALCVHWMEHNGLAPGGAPVVVTGATGGVAGVAIDILAGRGYAVTAVSGKAQEEAYLRQLGATQVLPPSVAAASTRPLDQGQWAGAVDSVGGDMLAWLLRSMAPDGVVTSVGNAGGMALNTTVLPLILRGVRLLGINANSPMALRRVVWAKLAGAYRPRHLGLVADVLPFEQLPARMAQMLARGTRGRQVVQIGGEP